MPLFLEIVRETWRREWTTIIRAFELSSRSRKDEQQSVQISLSNLMMPPTHCRVADDHLRCFDNKFRAVGKWTELTQ